MNRRLKRQQEKRHRKSRSTRNTVALRSFDKTLSQASRRLKAGKTDQAAELCQKVLKKDANHPVALYMYGLAISRLGEFERAAGFISKAVKIKPDYIEAHGTLGAIQFRSGNIHGSLAAYFNAIAHDPENQEYWSGLAKGLSIYSFTSADEELLKYLLGALDQPIVRPKTIAKSIFSALKLQPDITDLLNRRKNKLYRAEDYGAIAECLSAIPLLLRILMLCGINDPEAEDILTDLRHWLLDAVIKAPDNHSGLNFSVALSIQCFVTDYVFWESDTEKQSIDELLKIMSRHLDDGKDIPPYWLIAFGAYRPLFTLAGAERLLERKWPTSLQPLLDVQLSEPLEERSLRSDIPELTSISNNVSRAVREQYEESPFPRWTKTNFRNVPITMEQVLIRAGISLNGILSPLPKNPNILIAGCGTGAHAIGVATLVANCQVSAVDLSLSSLAYAQRKTNQLGIKNIQYGQADILELGTIGQTFDLIESVGVLHHMDDWMAGWRTLVDILRPGGLMRIGLYSETARQDVARTHDLIAEKGYTPSVDDIRSCRREIKVMATSGDKGMLQITDLPDFYSLNDCRDLLFHVQEHHLTLPQIEDAIKSLDLTFLGFESFDDGLWQRFREANPGAGAQNSFSAWHQFEKDNPYTFLGMYTFWVQKQKKTR